MGKGKHGDLDCKISTKGIVDTGAARIRKNAIIL
jgi:hypothetical protein